MVPIVRIGLYAQHLHRRAPRLTLFGWGLQRLKKPIFTIDLIIVEASLLMEIFFRFSPDINTGASPAALVLLRLWKIIRAIHAVAHSVEMRTSPSSVRFLRRIRKIEEGGHRATAVRGWAGRVQNQVPPRACARRGHADA